MSTQKCPFNHEKLAAYASGNIDPKDRSTVERHLAQCSICRKEVQILEQTWWRLWIHGRLKPSAVNPAWMI